MRWPSWCVLCAPSRRTRPCLSDLTATPWPCYCLTWSVPETEALVGQLREVLEPIAVTITAGIAQAGPSAGFEPEDAATEWINRVARALTLAATIPERLCTLPPAPASIV